MIVVYRCCPITGASLSISERSRLDLNKQSLHVPRGNYKHSRSLRCAPSNRVAFMRHTWLLELLVLPGPLQRPVALHRFAAAAVVSRLHLLVPLPPFTCGANNRHPSKGDRSPSCTPSKFHAARTHSFLFVFSSAFLFCSYYFSSSSFFSSSSSCRISLSIILIWASLKKYLKVKCLKGLEK